MTEEKRYVVIPGEVIASGNDYLPGEGTEKKGNNIISLRYGLSENQNKLMKVISLSGVYEARRGNVVIGRVENVTFNGWIMDIGSTMGAFLSVAEIFVSPEDFEHFETVVSTLSNALYMALGNKKRRI